MSVLTISIHPPHGFYSDTHSVSNNNKQDGTATQKTFMHVPSSIEAEEAEEIGVEHLLRDIKDLSTGTLSSRVSDQLSGLRGLQSRLTEIRDYLAQVAAGGLPVNHQIVYNLQDVFNLLPNLESTERGGDVPHDATAATAGVNGDGGAVATTSAGSAQPKRPFTVATNDQLLVMYLSSLIRAVIALHTLYVVVSPFAHSAILISDAFLSI
jgi:26S proteasome regulatory subunit N8